VGGSRPGNALYVPPPPDRLLECLGALEKIFHDEPVRIPTLFEVALAHVQFESIHPFLDGNGRLGRLLITFLLCAEGALARPSLYLSLYCKQNRARYYELLQRVRTHGDWEAWLRFFLDGVIETAEGAVATAQRIRGVLDEDRATIESLGGRAANSALRVHDQVKRRPIFSIGDLETPTRLSQPTVATAVRKLEAMGIVEAIDDRQRGRRYVYRRYVALLQAGTEPLG
jgi:Fic family protein